MLRPLGIPVLAALAATIVHAETGAAIGAEAPTPPLNVVGHVEADPRSWGTVDRSDFIFSRLNATGNSYDMVAFNFRDQSDATLATGIRDGRFLGRDDRYVIIADPRPPATRVRVFDTTTGTALASVNLRDGASWARVDGETLLLIQNLENYYGRSTKAALFEIATLKLLKSVDIGPIKVAASWRDRVVTVGRELRIFDARWNLTDTIALPEMPRGGRMSCSPHHLLITGDLAVVDLACGRVAVFDLESRHFKRIISTHFELAGIAVSGDLLVAVRGDRREGSSPARIFDLETGRLLGMQPVDGERLAADGDRLLAVRRLSHKKSLLTIYSIDHAAIRSGNWQDARILAECTAATEAFASDGDHYSAVDRCEAAGIATLARERWKETALGPVIRNFGSWLAAGFDRYREAIPYLEASISASASDHEVDAYLADARLKVRILDVRSPDDLTPADMRTPFGAAYWRAGKQFRSRWVPLDFIEGSTRIVFAGERLYAVRWRCDDLDCEVNEKPRLEAFGGEPFQSVASTDIPTEGEKEHISSIAAHADEIWIFATGEEEGPGNNTFVFEGRSLQLLRKGKLTTPTDSLFSREGVLLACDCSPGEAGVRSGTCEAVDPRTFGKTPRNDWSCASIHSTYTPVQVADDDFPPFIEAATSNYFVLRDRDGSEGYFFTIQPRHADIAPPPLLDKYKHRRYDRLIAIPGAEKVLVTRVASGTASLLVYDIETGISRTLMRFENANGQPFDATSDRRRAYLSMGRDLAIIDVVSGELRYYVRDLTPTGTVRLMLDGHWLLALPAGGGAIPLLDVRSIP